MRAFLSGIKALPVNIADLLFGIPFLCPSSAMRTVCWGTEIRGTISGQVSSFLMLFSCPDTATFYLTVSKTILFSKRAPMKLEYDSLPCWIFCFL